MNDFVFSFAELCEILLGLFLQRVKVLLDVMVLLSKLISVINISNIVKISRFQNINVYFLEEVNYPLQLYN